ncbi:MAG: iron-sulfur cluster assembly protein IscA [Gammaproteobacteria bacterium]|nr:MAG: iron-sulfur cluster assembly protein IscA [Gammaproteobacteria bacterium]
MAITITEKAANRVADFIKNRGKGLGIRLGVKSSGCSGLAYTIEFVDEKSKDDEKFITEKTNIFISKKDLVYLDGTQIDFAKEGLNEGFKFTNPNAKDACGCGESFTV